MRILSVHLKVLSTSTHPDPKTSAPHQTPTEIRPVTCPKHMIFLKLNFLRYIVKSDSYHSQARQSIAPQLVCYSLIINGFLDPFLVLNVKN
ncbi:hypothetical protein BpHYR1_032539 [Brachionus plicatilis]|uniref:Uncharacterized protein n=1 Tax=Brachionus plicatilis TaxID=10195 RepID=A0A3M7QAY1_BRAPC|nr:hypothetical protein BpHYR1_032539 [Brachionus plicatilis]